MFILVLLTDVITATAKVQLTAQTVNECYLYKGLRYGVIFFGWAEEL